MRPADGSEVLPADEGARAGEAWSSVQVHANAPPDDDIVASLGTVRELLAEQHPDLADLPLNRLGNGWDNELVRLGDDLMVRLPRRSPELLEHEQRWLPEVTARVGVEVPVPVRSGRPGAGYPWPWSIVRFVAGSTVASLESADRRSLAPALADFVRSMHVVAPPDAPANPVRGVPLASRSIAVEDRLTDARLADARLADVWRDALAAPEWAGSPVWIHGDLHPANLLVRDGSLVSVIDFGDITSGDPATDLATAWLTFDPTGRGAFRAALSSDPGSGYDEDVWRRARGWALVMASAIVVSPRSDSRLVEMAWQALDQVRHDA